MPAAARESAAALAGVIAAEADEFPITQAEFARFCDFFYAQVGVQFTQSKRYFVDRRIAERARAKNCATFRDYFALVRGAGATAEVQELINLLTVNETYFFREDYQLQTLVRFVLPEIARAKRPGDAVRLWSLPCSSGEEPYSIAIAVLETWRDVDQYDVEIRGSDIDTRILRAAAAGVYAERSLANVSSQLRLRYFRAVDGGYAVIPQLRESVDFSRVNLTDAAEMARHRDVDVLFCRNVLIYFDDGSRAAAVASIFDSLRPGGFLFLGHSENLNRLTSAFVPRRLGECIVYQRPLEAS